MGTPKETLGFQAEVKQLLHLMIHSLYSNKVKPWYVANQGINPYKIVPPSFKENRTNAKTLVKSINGPSILYS